MNIARRSQTCLTVVTISLMTLAITLGCQPLAQTEKPGITFTTPYQAALLSNNSVYFGKLSGNGTSNPVLTGVYYILSKQDRTPQQGQNTLVKRGKELHGPDGMYLNANSIIVVEPVGTDSKVAQLIQEANQQK